MDQGDHAHFELFTTDREGVAERTLHFEQIRGFFLQTMALKESAERIRNMASE